MKFYYYCASLLLRYKRTYDWIQAHKVETVDRMFIAGMVAALVGTALMFGSGEGAWALASFAGVVLIVIAKMLVGWAERK